MAHARGNSLIYVALFALFSILCDAAVVTYSFNISWLQVNPAGVPRTAMGINGQWPIPRIEATVGDNIIINTHNGLGNESTSLHFHGLFQNGTTNMDGAGQLSQCAIPPGSSFTYNFTVEQPGTYWYHSHVDGQYPDGLRGPFIVHDPESPYKGQYDQEFVLTLSDWYNDMTPKLLKEFISYTNPTGAEPIPNAALMNDTQNVKVSVQAGKTYLFRLINMGAFAGQYLWFEGHDMQVVEVDGVWTKPARADVLYMTVAQRYSVLVTARNSTDENFPIVASMDTDMFDYVPNGLQYNSTGWLTYDATADFPSPAEVDDFDNAFDDMSLVPVDDMGVYDKVDRSINLYMQFGNLGDGANYAFFNDSTFVPPKVPVLYSAMSTGEMAMNAEVYGKHSNAFTLNRNEVVEIVLNNNDPGKHPFHLHGHNFQVIYREEKDAGTYNYSMTPPRVPMRRDTLYVRGHSFMVLRFRADNPGIWMFHCHIEWHTKVGLVAVMVEAPTSLQQDLKISNSEYGLCKKASPPIPTAGNAAGNTVNLLDLSGANAPPAPLPAGFTPRGIVALVFSALSAVLGMAVISWYGMKPLSSSPETAQIVSDSSSANGSGIIARKNASLVESSDRVDIVPGPKQN